MQPISARKTEIPWTAASTTTGPYAASTLSSPTNGDSAVLSRSPRKGNMNRGLADLARGYSLWHDLRRGCETDCSISGVGRSSRSGDRRARGRGDRGQHRAGRQSRDGRRLRIRRLLHRTGRGRGAERGWRAEPGSWPRRHFWRDRTPPDGGAHGHCRRAHTDAAPLARRPGLRAHPSTGARTRTRAAAPRPGSGSTVDALTGPVAWASVPE
jgi:hypothetical protein